MNITTFTIKITFKDNQFIIFSEVVEFFTTYNSDFDVDLLNVYFIKGFEIYKLSKISKIEIISIKQFT